MFGGEKNRTAAMSDERFAHIVTDPKFRTLKRSAQRVKADSRFRSMINEERFTLKASAVDKRGRPKHTSLKEDLLRIYDVSGSSEDEDDDDDDDDDSSEKASADDQDEKQDSGKTEKLKLQADSQKDENAGLVLDIARGEGLEDSSDNSEDEDDDDIDLLNNKNEEDIEHAWGEMDKDAPQTTAPTSRLAVCNMDWDRIRAVDLLVLFNSFKPERGVIQSVTIYPSEYGLKKMHEEKIAGPVELKDLPVNDDDDEDETQTENGDDGKDYNREKLRQYQLSRLKFYYAVVACDSPETANDIYEKCDGIEYECSANKLDLRFVPDDMVFDQPPKSTATSLPAGATYEPSVFTNSALQCSSVTLTWDETPHERRQFMEKNFSRDEIEEQDLRDYIASDTDADEDPYGDLIDDSEWRRTRDPADAVGSDSDDDVDRIEKFKQLVRDLKDDKEHKDDKNIEMEVTWEPGLKEKTEKKIKAHDKQNKQLTPWEEFKEKKKRKRLEKKERKETMKRGEAATDDEDDELPAGIDLSDPYFAEELNKNSTQKGGKKKNKKNKKVEKLTPEEEEEMKRQQAELALLLMGDNDDTKKHFNLSERKKKKKDKKLKKKRKLDDKKDDSEKNELVDVRDPRFSAIYNNPLYNVDPSAPEFKKSKTMEAILEEKVKRRTKQHSH